MEYKGNNRQLGNDYVSVANQLSGSPMSLRTIGNRIGLSDINIPEYFRENGSLDGLKIPGIGKKTIDVLYLILTEGHDKAKETYLTKREEELKEEVGWHHRRDRPGRKGDISGSWDDAVRRYEG